MKRIIFIIIFFSFAIVQSYSLNFEDDVYYKTKEKKSDINYLDYLIPIGASVGMGNICFDQSKSRSLDLDLIAANILVSCRLSNENCYPYEPISLQLGIFVPTIGFGKPDYIGRKHKGKVFVAPIVDLVSIHESNEDGHYLHELSSHHHCTYFVPSTETRHDKVGFGGAILLKYSNAYLLGKITNTGFGVSLGICM